MSRIPPAILFIGVFVCTPLLALQQLGFFNELSDSLAQWYGGHLQLHGVDLVRQPLLSYGYYTVMAFLCAWIGEALPRQSHRFLFMLVLAFLTLTLSAVLAFSGVLFEPLSGIIAIAAAGLLGLAVSNTERGQRLQRFRKLFIGRLSEGQFAKLIEGKEPVMLNGMSEVTSITCRILNTDQLSQALLPDQVEILSSAFMKAVSEFLVEEGGYLDVCNAQGITVQFGFPVADKEHAAHATRVALSLRQFLQELTTELETRWGHRPVFGTGLSSGKTVCGLIGYGEFQFYSVLGSPPDMSRRLCHMCGVYGSPLLMSASTFTAAKSSIEVRPMELISAPGQTTVSEVYELLAARGDLTPPEAAARDAFWEGVVALRKGDTKTAIAKLARAEIKDHPDAARLYFLTRAQTAASGAKSALRVDELA